MPPVPSVQHDYLIKQWLHKGRTRPHHMFISNAAGYYGLDDFGHIVWKQRQRCPSCWMYDMSCLLVEKRPGAQPGRLLKHGGKLYTGTFHRFNRWDACGEPGGQFGYGRCRGKETQGQILMGYLARERGLHPSWHSDRLALESAESNVFANAGASYWPILYALWVGNCDPAGSPPPDHYDLCYRFKIIIPKDAILVSAQLALCRSTDQYETCHLRVSMLDRDSMAPFSIAVDDPNNPRRSNATGPVRLNVQGGDGNRFAVTLDNGGGAGGTWATLPDEIIKPMLQAFIDRPGYDPSGSYMGITLDSDQERNLTGYYYLHVPYYSASGFGPVLMVRWREKNSPPHPTFGSPPKLVAYQRFMRTASPVPPEGTWPADKPGVDAGGQINTSAVNKIPDQPYASAYRYCFLIPVDPLLSWWNEEEYGPAPYPQDAHQHFALNDCETYEIPCFKRTTPWRYVSLGVQEIPHVKGGLRGVVGFSSEAAQHGYLPVYALGCELGGLSYMGLDENTWRRYWGMTRPRRFHWTTDPKGRGWFVEYTAYLKAWFVQDEDFEGTCNPMLDHIGLPDGCMFRWNTWYQIEIRAAFPPQADTSDPDFQQFVLDHKAAFGATVTPRYSHCNDVLRRCGAGIGKAMGDNLYPPQACQDDMAVRGWTVGDETQYAPCKRDDGAYSWWYLPDYNSTHIKTPLAGPRIGAYPELGLYHQTKIVRKLSPDGFQTQEQYDWAILAFQSDVPWLLSANSGTEIKNEIHRLTITNPNGCTEPVSQGEAKVCWPDQPNWTSPFAYNATAAEVQAAIETQYGIGAGSLSVTGPDGGPWDLEYIGALTAKAVPIPVLEWCSLQSASGCTYSLMIEEIQRGSGHGD